MVQVEKQFFKVTTKEGKQHTSFVTARRARTVVYRPRKWTSPVSGCGPLCVFETLQAAQEFQRTILYSHFHIWQCKIHPSEEHSVWDAGSSRSLEYLPYGTVLADKVKLVKRVQAPI